MKIRVYTIELKTPRWLKRTLAFVVLPGIILLGAGAIVRAAAISNLTTFNPGDTLSSANINANFQAIENVINGVNGAAVANATNATTAGSATTATSASGLNCSGCVGASQLGSGAISIPAVDLILGTGTPIGSSTHPSYVGGDCPAGEILVSGQCDASSLDSLIPQTSAIDIGGKHWVCEYHNTSGGAAPSGASAPVVGSICLKATYP